jgi:hypothetical protein
MIAKIQTPATKLEELNSATTTGQSKAVAKLANTIPAKTHPATAPSSMTTAQNEGVVVTSEPNNVESLSAGMKKLVLKEQNEGLIPHVVKQQSLQIPPEDMDHIIFPTITSAAVVGYSPTFEANFNRHFEIWKQDKFQFQKFVVEYILRQCQSFTDPIYVAIGNANHYASPVLFYDEGYSQSRRGFVLDNTVAKGTFIIPFNYNVADIHAIDDRVSYGLFFCHFASFAKSNGEIRQSLSACAVLLDSNVPEYLSGFATIYIQYVAVQLLEADENCSVDVRLVNPNNYASAGLLGVAYLAEALCNKCNCEYGTNLFDIAKDTKDVVEALNLNDYEHHMFKVYPTEPFVNVPLSTRKSVTLDNHGSYDVTSLFMRHVLWALQTKEIYGE